MYDDGAYVILLLLWVNHGSSMSFELPRKKSPPLLFRLVLD